MNKAVIKSNKTDMILENTKEVYRNEISKFLSYSQGDISFNLAVEFLSDLQERGCKAQTYNKHISAIKNLYRTLLRLDKNLSAWERSEILERLSSLKHRKIEYHVHDDMVLELWEVSYIRLNVPDRLGIFVTFLYETGLRVSEAIGIRTRDIEETHKGLRIQITGKGGKVDDVFLKKETIEKIKSIYGAGAFLFRQIKEDKPVSRYWVTNELKRQGEKLLGRKITAHMLRHSFATHALRNKKDKDGREIPGIPLDVVSKYLRHSNVKITAMMYAHNRMSKEDVERHIWNNLK